MFYQSFIHIYHNTISALQVCKIKQPCQINLRQGVVWLVAVVWWRIWLGLSRSWLY